MTTLVLVRHATTASTGTRLGGRTQTPLDDGGRAQARGAAERLTSLRLRAVYASPLARTRETAEIVSAPHKLDVRTDDGLLEVEYGRWTDRPLKPLARTKLWPVIQARPSLVAFPDGETIRAAQLRAVDAVEAIVARHRRDIVALVTHADVIKAIVAFYLGQPLDLFQRLVVNPASVSILALSPGGQPALLRFNDDGPLGRGPGDDGPLGRGPGDDGPLGRGPGDDGPQGRGPGDDGPLGRGPSSSDEAPRRHGRRRG